jgi:hypothetical protein
MGAVDQAIHLEDAETAIYGVRTMGEVLAKAVAQRKMGIE